MSIKAIPVRLRRKAERLSVARRTGAGGGPVCHAPFTSMYLDQHGFVRACCQNAFHVLGNVTRDSLLDIWHGEPTRELRRALDVGDLSSGCEFCEAEVLAGRPDEAFSHWFDDFPVSAPDPDWPRQLELSITNTCNLQCAMCNGEWSSSIRSQREHRPPLPTVYGEEFFEQLREFIPHLGRMKIYGGEPFLASETLRTMELVVELGRPVAIHLTTNGTQWSPRVERILDMLPVDVAVSLDAATASTYEEIRHGSSWELVNRNLDRFVDRARSNGTGVTVTFCLMTLNWQEFWDFCRGADERGLGCAVNTVTDPSHLSLFRLDDAELEAVLRELERREAADGERLTLSRKTWLAELHRLRTHLERRRVDPEAPGLVHRRVNPEMPDPFSAGATAIEPIVVEEPDPDSVVEVPVLPDWVLDSTPFVLLDAGDRIEQVPADGTVIGVAVGQFVGQEVTALGGTFVAAFGPISATDRVSQDGRHLVTTFADGRRVRAFTLPLVADGSDAGSRLYLLDETTGA